jgi:hypothetical protein
MLFSWTVWKERINRIFNVVAKSEATFLELTVEGRTNWRLAGWPQGDEVI